MKRTKKQKADIRPMTEQEYRQAPGINISSLKVMERSPAHYKAALDEPNESTAAQVFGTALHAAVLEPKRECYVIRPEGMRFTTSEGKAWRDAQTLPILDVDDDCRIKSMLVRLHEHPIVGSLLKTAQTEVACFGTHSTGLPIKGRIDIIAKYKGKTVVADIKTTDDASPMAFDRSVRKYRYDRQAAFYVDLTGADRFLFIAVEKESPFAVAVYELSQQMLERARRDNDLDLRRLKMCMETDVWPAYGEQVHELNGF